MGTCGLHGCGLVPVKFQLLPNPWRSIMLDSLARAERFARRRAAATNQVHLVVRSHLPEQNYRVLTPADVLAEADTYCLADILFTADPDQLDLALLDNEPSAA
jgi:hypothetical protein